LIDDLIFVVFCIFEETLLLELVHAFLQEYTRALVRINTEAKLSSTLGEQLLVGNEVFLIDGRDHIDCITREEPVVVDHDEVDDLLSYSHHRVLDQSIVLVLIHVSSLLLLTLDVIRLLQRQALCCTVLLDE